MIDYLGFFGILPLASLSTKDAEKKRCYRHVARKGNGLIWGRL